MSRYIDVDALLKAMNEEEEELENCMCIPSYATAKICIRDFPTADVVEVVHGMWSEHKYAEESEGLLISNYECNQCHSWKREESEYCPNCGTKMDGTGDKLSPTGKKVE